MIRMIIFMIVLVVNVLFSQSAEKWKKAVKIAEKNLVTIEYYEEIDSPESVRNGNKVKRTLNGVIVDSSGLIMTSSSIFRAGLDFSGFLQFGSSNPPSDIKVRLYSGEIIPATFVGKDDDKDVGFIKAALTGNNTDLNFIKENNVEIGQDVFLAYHLDEQYNQQIAVFKKPVISIIPGTFSTYLVESLPADASFGIVLDMDGNAIGILKQSPYSHPYAYDYASSQQSFTEIIPAEAFIELIKNPPQFKKKDTNRKKWLGVNMQPFTRKLAKYFKNDSLKGILISTVLDDSPAKRAGLKSGDVIVSFNNQNLSAEENTDLQYFRNLVREFEGDEANVKIWRNGKFKELEIELSEVPISQHLADEVSSDLLGFSAKELTKDIIIAKKLDYDVNGVWISRVERAGWADLAGLQIGDLLLKIDNKDLHGLDQLKNFLKKMEKEKPEYINFFIKRRSETRFLFIKTNFN